MTHAKKPATQHGCPLSLLGDGDKSIEIVYDEEKKFVLGLLKQPKKNKNLLYKHDKPNEPTKEGSPSFVLFESPFTSVSTVSLVFTEMPAVPSCVYNLELAQISNPIKRHNIPKHNS
jgi:hypothetical protein